MYKMNHLCSTSAQSLRADTMNDFLYLKTCSFGGEGHFAFGNEGAIFKSSQGSQAHLHAEVIHGSDRLTMPIHLGLPRLGSRQHHWNIESNVGVIYFRRCPHQSLLRRLCLVKRDSCFQAWTALPALDSSTPPSADGNLCRHILVLSAWSPAVNHYLCIYTWIWMLIRKTMRCAQTCLSMVLIYCGWYKEETKNKGLPLWCPATKMNIKSNGVFFSSLAMTQSVYYVFHYV